MKSKNRIIARCKQPIKIEKLLQCLLLFSYRVGKRNIIQTVLLSLFFSIPNKMMTMMMIIIIIIIIIIIQLMFLSINIFWGPSQSSF